jgi:hypothetical protein
MKKFFDRDEARVIEVDGISFETVIPEQVVTIPPDLPDAQTDMQFGVRITNNTEIPQRFLLFYILPQFLKINRKKVLRRGPNSNVYISPQTSDFRDIMPGEGVTFLDRGWFSWQNSQLIFIYADKRCCDWYWDFIDFKPDLYLLRVIYTNPFPVWNQQNARMSDLVEVRDVWAGQISTPLVKFRLAQS